MTKNLYGNSWLLKILTALPLSDFFHVYIKLLICNHTGFLIQFEINLHLWIFQAAEIARAPSASALNFNFLKNSQVQINSKKPYDNLNI